MAKGAFGEVRKAIHKKTNMLRAVKIINKAHAPKEEQERLLHEVEILKTMVNFLLLFIFLFVFFLKK